MYSQAGRLRLAALCFSLLLLAITSFAALASSDEQQQASSAKTAVNYLLYSSRPTLPSADNANNADADEAKLAARIKQHVTNSSHYHMDDTVNIEFANIIWRRMADNAASYAKKRYNESKPVVDEFLAAANVSAECKVSLNSALLHLSTLDEWAVKMWNAFGDFPATGLFEGTFNSMGSYHQCLYHVEPNQYVGSPQHCVFKYQPVLPKRPRHHHLFTKVPGLANFTEPTSVSLYATSITLTGYLQAVFIS